MSTLLAALASTTVGKMLSNLLPSSSTTSLSMPKWNKALADYVDQVASNNSIAVLKDFGLDAATEALLSSANVNTIGAVLDPGMKSTIVGISGIGQATYNDINRTASVAALMILL